MTNPNKKKPSEEIREIFHLKLSKSGLGIKQMGMTNEAELWINSILEYLDKNYDY